MQPLCLKSMPGETLENKEKQQKPLSQKHAWADQKFKKNRQQKTWWKSSALPSSQHLSSMALTWQAYKHILQYSTNPLQSCQGEQ